MRAIPSILPFIAIIMSNLYKSIVAFKAPIGRGCQQAVVVRKVQVVPTIPIRPALHSSTGPYSEFSIARFSTSSVDADISLGSTRDFKENIPYALHTVMVHRNKQSLAFREGTPLVFTKSIAATYTELLDDSVDGLDDIPMGSLVAVVVNQDKSSNDKDKRKKKSSPPSPQHYTFQNNEEHYNSINQSQTIGYGVYNPHSMYRVRLLLHETIHPILAKEIRSMRKDLRMGHDDSVNQDTILQTILEKKMSDAIQLRVAMNLPSVTTDTYRLINGEGDGLSGLAVDVFGGKVAVIMSSAAWCEIHKDVILSCLDTSLKRHPSYKDKNIDVVWKNTPSRLVQDGFEVEHVDNANEDVSVVATESSIKYLTYPFSDGQKTGFYCDQRDNRQMIAKYCENKRVLDLCCYSGGFCLNAIIHGKAASALGVDSSEDAVNAATVNAKLNGLEMSSISFQRDDIATFMKNAIESNDEYDVVILDPPKLAPSISTLTKASRKYHSLNRDAMNLINKSRGGLLLTCTCSAAMSQQSGGQFFLNTVNSAALSAKRQATLLNVNGAAPCHTQSPASFPAGNYLTCALFFIGPID